MLLPLAGESRMDAAAAAAPVGTCTIFANFSRGEIADASINWISQDREAYDIDIGEIAARYLWTETR